MKHVEEAFVCVAMGKERSFYQGLQGGFALSLRLVFSWLKSVGNYHTNPAR